VKLAVFLAAWLCAIAPSHARTCLASWYDRESGRITASGERFSPPDLTAAHRSYPFGTHLRLSHRGRAIVVRIYDRGPARWTGRCIDLSQGAARALGMLGVARLKIERLN
jgi:rare lipoprotein A